MNESYLKRFEFLFYAFFLVSFSLLAAISPVLGFYVPIIFLALNFGSNKTFRILISIIILYSSMFVFASRNIASGSIKDDFANIYFPVFNMLTHGSTIFYYQFTKGAEFFLPLYFKIIYNVFGISQPVPIMAAVTALCLGLFYIWLEKYGLKSISENKRSLCVASSLALLVFAVTTQNMRQAISCVFLLYVITFYFERKWLLFYVFLFLATTSHVTALLIFPLFTILMGENERRKKILAATAVFVSLFFNIVIGIIIAKGLLGTATYKLLFYADVDSGDMTLGYLKYLFITCVVGIFYFSPEHKKYKSLLFYGTFIYFVLTPIPVVSHRLLMLMVAFMNGYLMFLAFFRILWVYRIILIGYCVYRIFKIGPYFSPDTGDDSFMNLWFSYPWVGETFLYYLK
ncbi:MULTISPECIES: EpsG family protein [Serratia]|uniref:EpsG family protein n=3 Tax=Serratia TaxID=613 RepID=A0A6H2ZQ09_SERMA|nr:MULTISPECIES: EpsG family protein [Serratia]MDP8639527.1 EpsG family protein [Serratia marcescens]MDP8833036.1 EpsG family protein [Serratia marcescens]OCO79220.1 hypothetical protein AN695_0226435 [Serratia marcescens]CAB1211687.1 hypothetical protein FB6_0898 [Serratia marcescens]BEN15160.1 hypothetical protein SMKC004_09550 [Serratia marcescens]